MSEWQDAPPDAYPFEIHGEPHLMHRPQLSPKRFEIITAQDGSMTNQDGRDENARKS